MRDKFRNNIQFALPAAIIAFVFFIYFGTGNEVTSTNEFQLSLNNVLLILPYLIVILLAFLGVDVFLVLIIGISLSGVLGMFMADFSFLDFGKKVYEGFTSMTEIFLLSLLTGGLAALVERGGGITKLLHVIKSKITGTKSALFGIGAFVSVADAATANNTIAIIISGDVAKKIADEYHIKKKAVASILDTFSCIVQGIIPYGAQVLILIGYSNESIDYLQLIKNSYYLHLLLIASLIYIFFGAIKECEKVN